MVIVHDEEYYRSRVPEPDLGPVRNFMRFVWNPNTRTLLGRTGKEWGLLGLFYLCFFSVLGSIFALQMWISIDYVSKLDKPFFLYSGLEPRSYFGNNFPLFRHLDFGSPGISFKPSVLLPTASPIIWVDKSKINARPTRYVMALTDFLQGTSSDIVSKITLIVIILRREVCSLGALPPEYNKSRDNYKSDAECDDERPSVPDIKPCFFDVESLGVCGRPPYGYTDPLQPCILIKFNKRFDWVPIHYNKSSQLPENMPFALEEIIRSSSKSQIWLWCDGANNVDKEHVGEIEYLPSAGFPVKYFPFVGQPGYLSPMVALRFKNITPGRLVTVECGLWAVNINTGLQKALDFQIILGES